jgi:hypothetical protein
MYKPNQRTVRVDLLAIAGWVTGTLHVPLMSSLVAYLNKKAEFMPLTDVPLDEDAPALEFLALRRQAIRLVIPDADDIEQHLGGQTGTFTRFRVRCILADASVEGTIQALASLRVSDFLETSPGFILLSDCSLSSDQGRCETGIRYLVVNTNHVLAVVELVKASAPALPDLEPVGAGTPSRR